MFQSSSLLASGKASLSILPVRHFWFVGQDVGLHLARRQRQLEGSVEGVLLLPGAVDHLAPPDHQEAGVADVGRVETLIPVERTTLSRCQVSLARIVCATYLCESIMTQAVEDPITCFLFSSISRYPAARRRAGCKEKQLRDLSTTVWLWFFWTHLTGGEASGFHQPLAIGHQLGAELPRVDAVLPPPADAVRHADDVG